MLVQGCHHSYQLTPWKFPSAHSIHHELHQVLWCCFEFSFVLYFPISRDFRCIRPKRIAANCVLHFAKILILRRFRGWPNFWIHMCNCCETIKRKNQFKGSHQLKKRNFVNRIHNWGRGGLTEFIKPICFSSKALFALLWAFNCLVKVQGGLPRYLLTQWKPLKTLEMTFFLHWKKGQKIEKLS